MKLKLKMKNINYKNYKVKLFEFVLDNINEDLRHAFYGVKIIFIFLYYQQFFFSREILIKALYNASTSFFYS